MEESKKYYTPSIEEFYVGFEFEYNENSIWTKKILEFYNNFSSLWSSKCDINLFRVKYLDKEDIESLGFSINPPNNYSGYEDFFNYSIGVSPYRLWFTYDKHKVKITLPLSDGKTLFEGVIKNKSELKKLLQQLNIV